MRNINSESSLPGAAILFSIFAGGCGTVNDDIPPDIKKPSIIYILADDLGYGDLGSFGQKNIMTLNLDSLAADIYLCEFLLLKLFYI